MAYSIEKREFNNSKWIFAKDEFLKTGENIENIEGAKWIWPTMYSRAYMRKSFEINDVKETFARFFCDNVFDLFINGKKVFAVGVTVVRALETPVTTTKQLKPFDGWTNKFIFPPYSFSIPDAMVTNFHMPGSTMLMSAAAFGGFDNVMRAYKEALNEGYKFGMYGDAMLII